MEITREKVSDLIDKLLVTVLPEDYQEKVKNVLKDYAKRANLKGFRHGKVPVSVVRKMFGKGVVFDELNKVISESLTEYLKSENIPLVGDPLHIAPLDLDIDPESNERYQFEYEIGLAPEFEVDFGLLKKITQYNVTIDEKILEEEIENLQERHGPMSNPEESQEGDILFGKLVELDNDGNPNEAGFVKMFAMNPKRIPSDKLKKEMGKGKKADDTFDINMVDVLKDDDDIRRFWEHNVQGEHVRNVSDDELKDIKSRKFRFEVKKINRIEKMELGQELYDKVFGEGMIDSEEAFKEKVRQDMAGFFNNEARKYYRSRSIKALIEGAEMPLPDEFLKKWLVRTREQITDANIDELYDSYARSLRWKLIIEKLQEKDPSLTIEEQDLREKAKDMVRQQFGQMVDGDEEKLEQFAQYYLQDKETVERLFDEVLEDRIFAYIDAQSAPVSEDITASDFMEKLKEKE